MNAESYRDVRLGMPKDAPEILSLMRLAHEESGEHPLAEEKIRERVDLATQRLGGMIGVVGDKELFGYVLMVIDPIWYADSYQLLELSNFVHPDHRRSTYAKQMICFAKACADGLGLDLTMGVYSNSRTEAKIRLYQRQVTPVGAFFSYHPRGI